MLSLLLIFSISGTYKGLEMDAREFTWKLNINPKVDFVSSRIWKDDNGDIVADEGVHESYEFRSCLRTYLLVKTSIRYPKTAQKTPLKPCASCRQAKSRIQNTPNSIAGCARKQGAVAIFDGVNRLKNVRNQPAIRLATWLHAQRAVAHKPGASK